MQGQAPGRRELYEESVGDVLKCPLKFLAQRWSAPVYWEAAQNWGENHWKGRRRIIPRVHTGQAEFVLPAARVESLTSKQKMCQS